MTLNGVMAVILRYFSEFGSCRGALRKSSRSLYHLLMSSCSYYYYYNLLANKSRAVLCDENELPVDRSTR